MTHTLIGASVLTAALSAALSAVLPAPPAIVVHRLAIDGDTVTQDRTVNGHGEAFYMAWAAGVFDAATGDAVTWCQGSGAFAYALGRKEVHMGLPDWTGREDCTYDSLPPGSYVLRATWSWGDTQESAQSQVFEVPE